jgi:hypothetical protein
VIDNREVKAIGSPLHHDWGTYPSSLGSSALASQVMQVPENLSLFQGLLPAELIERELGSRHLYLLGLWND